MDNIQVLICDDDDNVHETLGIYLKSAKIKFKSAYDGIQALKMLEEEDYDLMVLDIMMPKLDGIKVCTQIRRKSDMPIMMLTARGEEMDKLLALELGADDYVVKPFSPKEIVARIKVILKRTHSPKGQELKLSTLSIDIAQYKVCVHNKRVILSPKEIEILHLFMTHIGFVFTREKILDLIWGYAFNVGDRTVDTHIKVIRSKIVANEDVEIISVYGVGYKMEYKHENKK